MQVYVNKNDQKIAFVTSVEEDGYNVSVYSSISAHNSREEPLGVYKLSGLVDYNAILYVLPVEDNVAERGWVLENIEDSKFNFVVEY